MDMAAMIDTLISIILAGIAWFLINTNNEVKRLNILLNRTREDYATKAELKGDLDTLLVTLRRIEDRIERLLEK